MTRKDRSTREVAVVRHKGGGVNGERARRLNRVSQFQPKRSPQSSGAFGNGAVERDRAP